METLHVFAIAGSLRKQSTNMGLLRYAKEQAPAGVDIEIAELRDVPFYNQDIKEPPEAVQQLKEGFARADALLFGCNEYNYSLAPPLKNAIDWASREPGNVLLAGKPVAIVGAGGGMGSARAQYHLRQVCVYLDMHPLNKPEVFANAFAGAFDEEGNLVDESLQSQVVAQLEALQKWAAKLRQ